MKLQGTVVVERTPDGMLAVEAWATRRGKHYIQVSFSSADDWNQLWEIIAYVILAMKSHLFEKECEETYRLESVLKDAAYMLENAASASRNPL